MGLFKKLFGGQESPALAANAPTRVSGTPSAAASASTQLPQQVDPDADARVHHYYFAHRALPQQVFKSPIGFALTFMNGQPKLALLEMWNRVGSAAAEDSVPGMGLDVQYTMFTDATGATPGDPVHLCHVMLPPPQRVTECYFVTAVVAATPDGQLKQARYLTLELGFDEGKPATFVGEWLADGQRAHHGHGSAPTFEAWKDWVTAHLANSSR